MTDIRGSNWRKWDLHIHTPASYHWNGEKYRSNMNERQRNKLTMDVIEAINKSDVSVFGIMDYWTLDGYIEIRRFLKANPTITCNKTIFPGIELRVESPTKYRMNVHILLSDDLSDQQLYDFKSRLRIRDSKRNLSDEAIIATARTLVPSKAKIHGHGDPQALSDEDLFDLGCKTIEITRESLDAAIRELSDNCLVIMPYDTYNGLEDLEWENHPFADSDFMKLADIFEAHKMDNINLFLGVRTDKNARYIDDFIQNMGRKPKPAISGSDAHSIKEYGVFPSNKATWLKADPTFNGLKQVLVDPSARTFIGDIPPALVRVNNNKTKYLRSLQVKRLSNSSSSEEAWFDNDIQFNHGLIAIIGNKGNGKSALVDIIALLSEYHRKEFFSFLNDSKFRHPKAGKAQHFTARLTWENEVIVERNLSDISTVDGGKIRYIPQQFFERICNETEIRKESEFDVELKKVIFSHVEEHDRLGYPSLDELIDYRTAEINQSTANLRAQMVILNKQISALETQLTAEYKQELEKNLAIKQMELQAHDSSKPEVVSLPTTTTENTNKIAALRQEVESFLKNIHELKQKQEEVSKNLVIIDKTVNMIESFRVQYNTFVRDVTENLQALGLAQADLISVNINTNQISLLKDQLRTRNDGLETEIEEQKKKVDNTNKQIKIYQDGMDAAHKAYQQYLSDVEKWEQGRNELLGDNMKTGSIKYYQQKIKDIADVIPPQLKLKQSERNILAKDIYMQISKAAAIYRELYAPVQHFIDTHPLIKNKYKLKFEVAISLRSDFTSRFFQYIRQNISGPFHGREEGELLLRSIITKYDFNDIDDTVNFINNILASFDEDKGSRKKVNRIQDQLKNCSLEEFYDFLFGMTYLEPDYALVLDGKKIPQLSPGERGILLLIFYLLVDGHDCPLIIDQPEENLDNQSIYELLVPCIEEAKQRRQIILVTHNANLAVVCDADQIIHASIDKSNGNKVLYKSGSIENPEINRLLVNILEGTWPAFRTRHSMYQLRLEE